MRCKGLRSSSACVLRVALVGACIVSPAGCSSGNSSKSGSGVSCAADGTCQPQCTADPDCVGGGGSGGTGTDGVAGESGSAGAGAATGSGGGNGGGVQSCGPDRYQDNMDGTVTDCSTGLIWQQDSGQSFHVFGDAAQYCQELTLGAESGWRVPSKDELVSILQGCNGGGGDYPGTGCRFDQQIFKGSCANLIVWSSTMKDTSQGWGVCFSSNAQDCGCGEFASPVANAGWVRCVSGGSSGSGGTGGTGATGGSTGSGGSANLCPSPYRCNPKTKEYTSPVSGDVVGDYKYLLEKCNPATGGWSTNTDCSKTSSVYNSRTYACMCSGVGSGRVGDNYARCSYGSTPVCDGVNYTW
jgi:hypothetical protein